MSWLSAVNTFIDRIGLPGGQKNGHSPEEIVTDLYWGLLEREPDRVGLQSQAGLLHGGTALEHVVRGFIASPEFRARMLAALVPPTDLPDLTQAKNGNGRSPEEIVTGLYRGLLGRDPDRLGLQDQAGSLHAGTALEHVVRSFVGSPEFRARMLAALVPTVELPDLTLAMPEHYETQFALDAGDRNRQRDHRHYRPRAGGTELFRARLFHRPGAEPAVRLRGQRRRC